MNHLIDLSQLRQRAHYIVEGSGGHAADMCANRSASKAAEVVKRGSGMGELIVATVAGLAVSFGALAIAHVLFG